MEKSDLLTAGPNDLEADIICCLPVNIYPSAEKGR